MPFLTQSIDARGRRRHNCQEYFVIFHFKKEKEAINRKLYFLCPIFLRFQQFSHSLECSVFFSMNARGSLH
jgi:hypothetical protein